MAQRLTIKAWIAIAFAFAVLLLLVIAASTAFSKKPSQHVQEVLAAPTEEVYRTEMKSFAAPFFRQAQKITSVAEIQTAPQAFLELAEKTHERALRVRVPGSERDTHLEFVLLLDQWKRALKGSVADREAVSARTANFLSRHEWIQ